MMDQKITPRESLAIDCIKAIAVLGVIAAHVIAISYDSIGLSIVSHFWARFSKFAVPSFFIIGGFLYKREKGDEKDFRKKKFFRIILPWVCCSVITYAYVVIFGGEISVIAFLKWALGSGTWYYYATMYTLFLFAFKYIYIYEGHPAILHHWPADRIPDSRCVRNIHNPSASLPD